MKINKLKFFGAMVFFTILMDVVPSFGFIRIGKISITNLQIPTILSGIVLGPGYGILTGLVFGIISMLRAVSRESAILDVLLQNPLVSVLPRLCVGPVAGFLYRLLNSFFHFKWQGLSAALSAAAGALCNGFLVLLAVFSVYPDELIEILGVPGKQQLAGALFTAFRPNVLVESLVCTVVCALTVMLLNRFYGQKSKPSEP